MKRQLQYLLMTGFVMLCGQAFAAEKVEMPEQKHILKTGIYRNCWGTIDECVHGKGTLGGDDLDFEKNNTGRYTFKYEETPFVWRQEGNTLFITKDDGKEIKTEVLEGSGMLVESGDDDPTPYMLIEAEDDAFRPGLYLQCEKAAVEKCAEFVDSYLNNEEESSSKKNPYTFLMLYTEATTGAQSQLCPKGKTNCLPLTWEQEDKQIKVSFTDTGAKKTTLTVDKNRLIDKATNNVYLRAMSERVLRGSN